jgi:hypothetical protein
MESACPHPMSTCVVWCDCCCRYLIQNLTGSDLWYWADQSAAGQGRGTGQHRVYLPAYVMQELKVWWPCFCYLLMSISRLHRLAFVQLFSS